MLHECPIFNLDHWTPPSFPFLKLNVDGAVDLSTGLCGLGAVLCNDKGELLRTCSTSQSSRGALVHLYIELMKTCRLFTVEHHVVCRSGVFVAYYGALGHDRAL